MQDFVACKVPFFGGTEPKLFLLKRETRKIVLVMKITAVLMLAAVLQVSAKSWGQEKITLSFNNAPLEQVLNSIHSQANVEFIYRTDYVKDKKVTVNVSNASLKTVLDLCLQNQQLTYDIFGKNVSIHPEKKEGGKDGKPAGNSVSGSGPGDVTGRVTDPQGEPISGANVIIKRTGSGTITNANGQFTLKNLNNDDVILISYVGYSPLSIKVGDKTTFLLVMNVAANKLDVAVVQAYGNTTERLRTGNITTVTSQEIEHQPVMNVLQALQGKVPGLEITPSSGYANASYKIEIRGRKYMSNDVAPDPLIIVDGVPLTVLDFQTARSTGSKGFDQTGVPSPIYGRSPLFSIDPNEIESITVLKDADATAIYGSRGGSGVIIINTKKAKAGKTTFNASYSTGFEKNLKFYNLLNTQQYVMMRREALNNDNLPIDPSNAIDLASWDTTRYTDWQRYLYGGTGRITTADASVSGGDKSTKFRIAMNYDTRQSISALTGSNDRISFQSNISHSSTNNIFKFDLTNYYSFAKSNEIGWPLNAVLLPPNAPAIFNASGKLNFQGWDSSGTSDMLTAFSSLVQPYTSKTHFSNSRFGITISPFKGFSFKNNLGYSSVVDEAKFSIPIISQNPANNPTGSLNNGLTKGNTWIIEPQAEYKYLHKKFSSEVMVGSTYQYSMQNSFYIRGYNYTDDNLLNSVANAPTRFASDATGQYKYFAIFGRINFNLGDKYIVNLNGRRDGSSRFGPGKQFGNFGSIGGAWIVSQEKWFKPMSRLISFAKIRSSYGTIGSDNINDYVYLTRWTTNLTLTNPYGGTPTYLPTQHANPDLQWQVNRKLEVAGNFNFFGDRLNTDISWYQDRCTNQLLAEPLPALTGFVNVSANLPATVQNSGIELKLTGAIVKSKSFNVATNFNVGKNNNKLLKFPGIENTAYSKVYVVGKSLNTRYVVHYTGVDPSTGEYTFEDKNKDGTIDIDNGIASKDVYGLNIMPKYFGGGGLDISYKALTLNMYFTFANIPYALRGITDGTFGQFGFFNESTKVLNRWQKPGDHAEYSRFKTSPTLGDQIYGNSDAIYTNASYLRCQNISLSFALPIDVAKKVKCQNANFFARAENVFTISKFDGLDPTAGSLGSYPMPFTVTVGANLSF